MTCEAEYPSRAHSCRSGGRWSEENVAASGTASLAPGSPRRSQGGGRLGGGQG